MPYSFNIHIEAWPLAGAFRISRGTRKVSDVLMVEVNDGNYVGRGSVSLMQGMGKILIAFKNS